MSNPFTDHPHAIGESYLEHMKHALVMGIMTVLGGFACIIHAIFPFLFINTATNIIINFTRIFVQRMPKDEPRLQALYQQMQAKYTNEQSSNG